MGLLTNTQAQNNGFILVKDATTGRVTRIALTADTQVGTSGSPAELQLLGRLSLSNKAYVPSQANAGNVAMDGNATIAAVAVPTTSSTFTNVNVSLPTNPRQGQLAIVKDTTGNSTELPIFVKGASGMLIDGQAQLVMSSAYEARMLAYVGTSWSSISALSTSPAAVQRQIATTMAYFTSDWVESTDISQAQTTIATGSDSVPIATAGTINVNSTGGFFNSGTLTVLTTTGVWIVQYTGRTATSFTGCLTLGTGVMFYGGLVTQSALNITGPWNRMFTNTNVQFGTMGGRVILESVQQMSTALVNLGITGPLGIPGVNMFYWPETQVGWVWPSSTGYFGAHVYVEGPGAAGIIQSFTPNGTLTTKWIIGSFHGTCELSNLTFTGDPNAPKVDGAFLIPLDANYMISISGNTWNCQLRDLEFYSFCCTNAVLGINGLTGPNLYERLHFSGCGTATTSSPPAPVGTSGVMYVIGAENGHHINGASWIVRQLPLYQLPSKAFGYGPSLFIDESESPGTNTGTGVHMEFCWFADTSGCAVCINPTGGNGSTVGMVSMAHCYFATNCYQETGIYAGAVHLDHGILSFKMERCTDFRNNQALFPLLGFASSSVGPCEVIENQTPMWASTTVLPNVTLGKPQSLKETFNGVVADYMLAATNIAANQLVILGTVFPGTVQTASTITTAQNVRGVAASAMPSGSFGPVNRLHQPGVTVINDGALGISIGGLVTPSAQRAGAVANTSTAINALGIAETSVTAQSGSTLTIYARCA